MTYVTCDKCGRARGIRLEWDEHMNHYPPDKIQGIFICYKCGAKSPFELTDNILTFKPAGRLTVPLASGSPNSVGERYEEAILCMYAGAYRGAAVMARATVEGALDVRGVRESDLKKSITTAKEKGLLGDEEVSIAHGSRLVGNGAIHEAEQIELGQVPPVLSAAAMIVNHLFA